QVPGGRIRIVQRDHPGVNSHGAGELQKQQVLGALVPVGRVEARDGCLWSTISSDLGDQLGERLWHESIIPVPLRAGPLSPITTETSGTHRSLLISDTITH